MTPLMSDYSHIRVKPDAESSVRLRELRFWMGYGRDWTFWQALWDKVEPFVGWAMIALAVGLVILIRRCTQ